MYSSHEELERSLHICYRKLLNMNIFEILVLRSKWEELAQTLKVDIDSSISGLKLFIEYGYQGNRFKQNYPEAMKIAEQIVRGA